MCCYIHLTCITILKISYHGFTSVVPDFVFIVATDFMNFGVYSIALNLVLQLLDFLLLNIELCLFCHTMAFLFYFKNCLKLSLDGVNFVFFLRISGEA